MRRAKALPLALVAPLLVLTACSGSSNADGSTLTVSAAASLTESFTELATQFEADHPGTTVRLNFGGSSSLAEQVVSGAPVDVFASASRTTMDTVVQAGAAADDAPTFTTNSMTIAVPSANRANLTSIADLAKPGVRVAECAPEVPCGAAARKTLQNAGVAVTPVTLDPDVKTVLGRVAAGEVDAGLVYVTDIRTANVAAVPIPAEIAATNEYAITVVKASPQQDLARQFVDFVTGPTGQQVLATYGFGTP